MLKLIGYYDPSVPFKAACLQEAGHADLYLGKVIAGPMTGFNLFFSCDHKNFQVFLFGRGTVLATHLFEHIADINYTMKTLVCGGCGKTVRESIDPYSHNFISCPECECCMHVIDVVKNAGMYFSRPRGKKVLDRRVHELLLNVYNGIEGCLKSSDQAKPWRMFRIGQFGYYYSTYDVCFYKDDLNY